MKCPSHIEKFVKKLSKDNKFFECEFDDYHIPYTIKCSCGSEEFEVFINEIPTVIAKCCNCGNNITVYDLKLYPAATIVSYNEEFKEYISQDEDKEFNLCVIYEYSLLESDQIFDPNDITWCEIYGYGLKSHKIFEILNDETA